jgi:hypothetical protein
MHMLNTEGRHIRSFDLQWPDAGPFAAALSVHCFSDSTDLFVWRLDKPVIQRFDSNGKLKTELYKCSAVQTDACVFSSIANRIYVFEAKSKSIRALNTDGTVLETIDVSESGNDIWSFDVDNRQNIFICGLSQPAVGYFASRSTEAHSQ